MSQQPQAAERALALQPAGEVVGQRDDLVGGPEHEFARMQDERIVAVRDFSGFASSPCALARAPAIAPIVWLERCMTALPREKIETHSSGFRTLGPNAMTDGFLGVFRHQAFEFSFGLLMI